MRVSARWPAAAANVDIVEGRIIGAAKDKTFAPAQKNLCQSQWQLALAAGVKSPPRLSLYSSKSYGGDPKRDCGRSHDGDAPLTEPALTGSEGEPPPPKGAVLDGKQLEFLATKAVPPRCAGLLPR